jgi:hypothetical protein
MKHRIIITLIILIQACSASNKTKMSPDQEQQVIDSLIKLKHQELMIKEQELLRDRLSIEVPQRVDSLLGKSKKSTFNVQDTLNFEFSNPNQKNDSLEK